MIGLRLTEVSGEDLSKKASYYQKLERESHAVHGKDESGKPAVIREEDSAQIADCRRMLRLLAWYRREGW